MAVNRMNREEFYAKVTPLDAEQLRKILWTLYWRSTAQVRERVEDALNPTAGCWTGWSATVPWPGRRSRSCGRGSLAWPATLPRPAS